MCETFNTKYAFIVLNMYYRYFVQIRKFTFGNNNWKPVVGTYYYNIIVMAYGAVEKIIIYFCVNIKMA